MTLSRRINAIERKVCPKLTPVEEMLCQNEGFVAMLRTEGIDIEDLKRNGSVIGGLPHELKKLLVERLKAEINRRRSEHDRSAADTEPS